MTAELFGPVGVVSLRPRMLLLALLQFLWLGSACGGEGGVVVAGDGEDETGMEPPAGISDASSEDGTGGYSAGAAGGTNRTEANSFSDSPVEAACRRMCTTLQDRVFCPGDSCLIACAVTVNGRPGDRCAEFIDTLTQCLMERPRSDFMCRGEGDVAIKSGVCEPELLRYYDC